MDGRVPNDWCGAGIMSLCKEKGDNCECGNFKDISMLWENSDCRREKPKRELLGGGWRSLVLGVDVEYADQIFVVRQICEKFLAKGR